jgi:hypothetical protein
LISVANRRKRLEFAAQHKDWKVEDWEKVLWSDESAFDIFNAAKRVFVRRRQNEKLRNDCVVPTVKFGGGKVMVWGCMSSHGVGILKRVDGNLNANGYREILRDCMIPSAGATYGSEEWMFQQDNAPCHKARTVIGWLEENEVDLLTWPAQSPDLNPIEHLWEILFQKISGKRPGSAVQLYEMLEAEWKSISVDVCADLVSSMPRRVEAVLKARGGYTRY